MTEPNQVLDFAASTESGGGGDDDPLLSLIQTATTESITDAGQLVAGQLAVADAVGPQAGEMVLQQQTLEVNGQSIVLQQGQDPETGELVYLLQDENGQHIAVSPDCLPGLIGSGDGTGNGLITVAVSQSGEGSMVHASDAGRSSELVAVSLENLAQIAESESSMNIPHVTTIADTHVVQAIDTPKMSIPSQVTSTALTAASDIPEISGSVAEEHSELGSSLTTDTDITAIENGTEETGTEVDASDHMPNAPSFNNDESQVSSDIDGTATRDQNSAQPSENSQQPDYGQPNVIQVDNANGTSLEDLVSNALVSGGDGNYVIMTTGDDGTATEINLADLVNAGGASDQAFLIETPDGYVTCGAPPPVEQQQQVVENVHSATEDAILQAAQQALAEGNLQEGQLIQTVTNGQTVTYQITSANNGSLELTQIITAKPQSPKKQVSRNAKPKQVTAPSNAGTGETLLMSNSNARNSMHVLAPKASVSPVKKKTVSIRAPGGISGTHVAVQPDSNQLTVTRVSPNKSFSNNSFGSGPSSLLTATAPGPSQLASSRRTYSKKNIVWLNPEQPVSATTVVKSPVKTVTPLPVKPVTIAKTTPLSSDTVKKGTSTVPPSNNIIVKAVTAPKSSIIAETRVSPVKSQPIVSMTRAGSPVKETASVKNVAQPVVAPATATASATKEKVTVPPQATTAPLQEVTEPEAKKEQKSSTIETVADVTAGTTPKAHEVRTGRSSIKMRVKDTPKPTVAVTQKRSRTPSRKFDPESTEKNQPAVVPEKKVRAEKPVESPAATVQKVTEPEAKKEQKSSTTATVTDVTAVATEADVTTAATVADVTTAATVAGVTTAATVADVTTAATVADVTTAATVADVTTAATVADVTTAATVADDTTAATLADVTTAETPKAHEVMTSNSPIKVVVKDTPTTTAAVTPKRRGRPPKRKVDPESAEKTQPAVVPEKRVRVEKPVESPVTQSAQETGRPKRSLRKESVSETIEKPAETSADVDLKTSSAQSAPETGRPRRSLRKDSVSDSIEKPAEASVDVDFKTSSAKSAPEKGRPRRSLRKDSVSESIEKSAETADVDLETTSAPTTVSSSSDTTPARKRVGFNLSEGPGEISTSSSSSTPVIKKRRGRPPSTPAAISSAATKTSTPVVRGTPGRKPKNAELTPILKPSKMETPINKKALAASSPRTPILQKYNEFDEEAEKSELHESILSLNDTRTPEQRYDYADSDCSFHVRQQSTATFTPRGTEGSYACQKCGFRTTRMNNLVWHHKDQCPVVKNLVMLFWENEIRKQMKLPTRDENDPSESTPKKTSSDLSAPIVDEDNGPEAPAPTFDASKKSTFHEGGSSAVKNNIGDFGSDEDDEELASTSVDTATSKNSPANNITA